MTVLDTLLLGHHDEHTVERITSALDEMTPRGRLEAVRGVATKNMAALWKLFEDVAPVDAEYFVPSSLDPLKQVIHHGKNSLPAFNFFQKRFCKADDESGELWGYNHQSNSWFTGPGYYVAHTTEDEKDPLGAYVIDYTRIPPKKPTEWPEIKKNESGFSNLVYAHMKDYMRGISAHVSIGKAVRRGKETENYFLLCREDPE